MKEEHAELLFGELIFGPLQSRRLGSSLGINLLPVNGKVCNYDCVYCECGWTDLKGLDKVKLPSRDSIREALNGKLIELAAKGVKLDAITFAGNGEPTLHPEFKQIMEDVVVLRNSYYPRCSICVLSNSSMVHIPEVLEGLKLADQAIMKLDAGTEEQYYLIDRPVKRTSLKQTVEQLKQMRGNLIIQTLFTRGVSKGRQIDNTTEKEINSWLQLLGQLHPEKVMLYSIDRATPSKDLEKVSQEELELIAFRVLGSGIPVQVR